MGFGSGVGGGGDYSLEDVMVKNTGASASIPSAVLHEWRLAAAGALGALDALRASYRHPQPSIDNVIARLDAATTGPASMGEYHREALRREFASAMSARSDETQSGSVRQDASATRRGTPND